MPTKNNSRKSGSCCRKFRLSPDFSGTTVSVYSETDSTAASANDTKAPTSNSVMQTPTQNIKITAERTSTFMVVTLRNIILKKQHLL